MVLSRETVRVGAAALGRRSSDLVPRLAGALLVQRLFERYLAQSRLQSTEGERDRQSGSSPQRGPRGPAMATERKPMPKWKIDTIEAAIQDLQRLKVPITASRIHSARDRR